MPTRAIYGIFDQPKEPVRQEYFVIVCDLSGYTIRILCLLEVGYSDAELPVMLLSQMVQESKEYSTIRPSWIARASASAALYIPRRPSVGAQAHACSCMRARALRRLGQLWHTHCGSSLRILCYFDIRARIRATTPLPCPRKHTRPVSLRYFVVVGTTLAAGTGERL